MDHLELDDLKLKTPQEIITTPAEIKTEEKENSKDDPQKKQFRDIYDFFNYSMAAKTTLFLVFNAERATSDPGRASLISMEKKRKTIFFFFLNHSFRGTI